MDYPRHSVSKTRSIEIPVGSMLSPDSEVSGSTVYTRPSSLESALPRINHELRLPNQELRSKSSSVFPEVRKETKKSEDGLELPGVQGSKYFLSFSDLQQPATTDSTRNLDFPGRPLKVSKLLKDRICVLEDALKEHLTAAKEIIQHAEIDEKQERGTPLRSGKLRSGKDLATRRYSQGAEKHKRSVQRKDNVTKSRALTGKRLRKPNSASSISRETVFRQPSAGRQTYQDASGKKDAWLPTEAKEKHVVSMLEITKQSAAPKDVRISDGNFNGTLTESGLSSKNILKQRKKDASKPENLTKAVNKTIRQLYRLNKQREAENLSDLLESKLMTEKELNKAIKRELQEEREENERQEAKNIETSRREALFHRMEELERLEEKMRETRMRERETRRAEALRRREKNIALWNEKQKSTLSTKISRAIKFSYFPLLIHSSSSSDDEQSSSEDSDSSSSFTSASVSRQSSACACATSTNKRNNRSVCSSYSRQNRK